MGKEILISVDENETRAVVLEDGVLTDIYVERSIEQRYAGNIYKGKVENVLPGMQAAFINVGLERNAFLYVEDAVPDRNLRGEDDDVAEIDIQHQTLSIKDILKPGQDLLVQITKEPIGTKGARVITNVTLPGKYVVLMPTVEYVGVSRRIENESERERLRSLADSLRPQGMGIIVRTAAEGKDERELRQDVEFLAKVWRKIQNRYKKSSSPYLLHREYDLVYRVIRDLFAEDVSKLIIDDEEEFAKVLDLINILAPNLRDRAELYRGELPIFTEYGIESEINKALKRKVWLDCGGYLVIDQTEALTCIDVNTGKYTGSIDLADTVLKTNIEAAVEIARQLRLRNIGGIIIIDFIDMDDPEAKKQVLDALERELAKDRTKSHVFGFTNLGLVEITRKKVRQGLDDVMLKLCPYCEGKGKVLSEETLALKAEREIRQVASTTGKDALLVEAHPSVAALLIGSGGTNLEKLEKHCRMPIYIKGRSDMHVEELMVLALDSEEELKNRALPVKSGDKIELIVQEQHVSNPEDGISRIDGYVIDIENAGNLIGERVKAEITKVFRTYAKARLHTETKPATSADSASQMGKSKELTG